MYELPKFRSRHRRERFLMRMTATATRRETRSKFEAEDGGATKLAAENLDAFIHASDSLLRVSYTAAAAVASAAAAAATRTKKLPKRTKEKRNERQKEKEGERKRRKRATKYYHSASGEAALPGRNFAGS